MKKSFKHLPFPTILALQIFTFLLLSLLASDLIFLFEKSSAVVITVVVLSSIAFVNVMSIPLSILFWWNKPFVFESNGITKKNKNNTIKYEWKNAKCIKLVASPRWLSIGRVGIFWTVIIYFSNSEKVSFEWDVDLNKKIVEICEDDFFVALYKDFIKNNNG